MKIPLGRAQPSTFCFVTCVISVITQRTSWLHSSAFFFHTMWPRSSPPPTLIRYLDISRCLLALITAKLHYVRSQLHCKLHFFSLHFVLHILRQLHNRTMDGRETITAQNKANENSATRRAAHKIEVSRGSCTSHTSMLTDVNALHIYFLPCTKN